MTPELREAVLRRDGGCIAARMEPEHGCTDRWGMPHSPTAVELLTLDHVKDQPRMGRRAQSDPQHLVSLCWGAHLNTSWATSNRPALREYLRSVA